MQTSPSSLKGWMPQVVLEFEVISEPAGDSWGYLTATAPPDATIAPQGTYMLFILYQGVPAEAEWIQVMGMLVLSCHAEWACFGKVVSNRWQLAQRRLVCGYRASTGDEWLSISLQLYRTCDLHHLTTA